MVKIRLIGASPDEIETLWATPVATKQYRLENSPFYAYGVSWQDIVEAQPDEAGYLEFVRTLRKSGNRTVRVIFQNCRTEDPPAQIILSELLRLGVTAEGFQPLLVSLNVPPSTELQVVADFLTEQAGLTWEYADPTYDEIYGITPD